MLIFLERNMFKSVLENNGQDYGTLCDRPPTCPLHSVQFAAKKDKTNKQSRALKYSFGIFSIFVGRIPGF